jgi:mRNA interferase MazF
MRRGEVWTVAGGKDYASKPRPVVIVQDDAFSVTASITICALTTVSVDAPLLRPAVEPSERNGLRSPSLMMVDKITTVPKSRLGAHLGRLDDEDIVRLNQAMMVFLGLATSPRAARSPA